METMLQTATANDAAGRIELRAFLNARRVSGYQYRIYFLCFLVMLLDGYETVVVGFIAPSLRHAWTLHHGDLALMFGMGLAGLAIGSFCSGPIADSFGRKGVIVGSVALFGAVSLLSAWSTSIAMLTALRFMAGIGLGGAMPNTYTLAAEFCPDRLRSTLVAPIGCGISAGGVLCGVLAAHLIAPYGWQSLLIVGGILPMLLLPLLMGMLPESVRYRIASGKGGGKLLRTMQAIAPECDFAGKRFVIDETGPASAPIRTLFSRNLFGGTLLLWSAAFCCLLVVYFLGSWLPTLIGNAGIALPHAALMTSMYLAGNTLGAVVLGYCMDRRNPQYVLAAAFMLAGAAMASFGHLLAADAWPVLPLLALFFGGAGSGGAMTCINILAAGFYPTASRATGVSWTLAIGRIGSVCSSFLGGAMLAAHWRIETVFATVAAPIFAAALCMLALSAYRRRQLVWGRFRRPAKVFGNSCRNPS